MLVSDMKYDAIRAALKAMGLPAKGTKIDMASVLCDALKSGSSTTASSQKSKRTTPAAGKKQSAESSGTTRKSDRRTSSRSQTTSIVPVTSDAPNTAARRTTRNSKVEPPTPSDISFYSKTGSRSSRAKSVEVLEEEDEGVEEEEEAEEEEEEEEEEEDNGDDEDSDDASLAKYSTDSDNEEDIAEDVISAEETRTSSPIKIPASWPSFGSGFTNAVKPPTDVRPFDRSKFELPKGPTAVPAPSVDISGLATKKQGLFSSLKQQPSQNAQTPAPASTTATTSSQLSSVVDLTVEAPPKIDTNSEELLESLNRRFMEAVQGGPKLSEVEHKLMLDLINTSRNPMESNEMSIVPKIYVQNGPLMQKTAPPRASFGGMNSTKYTEPKKITTGPLIEKRLASSFLAADPVEDNIFQRSKRSRVAENYWGSAMSAPVVPALGMTNPANNVGVFPRPSSFANTPSKAKATRFGSASLLGLQPTPSRQDLKRNLLVTSLQRRKSFGGRLQTPIKLTVGQSSNEGRKTVAKRILQSLGDMASPLEVHRKKPVAAHWGITGSSGRAHVIASASSEPASAFEHVGNEFNDMSKVATPSVMKFQDGVADSHSRIISGSGGISGSILADDENENSSCLEKNGVAIGEGEDFSFAAPVLIQEDLDVFDGTDKSSLKMEFSFSAPSVAEKQTLVNKQIDDNDVEKDENADKNKIVIESKAEGADSENDKPKKSIWEMASDKWKCQVCLGQNDPKDEVCILCEAPKGAPPVMGGAPDATADATKPANKPFTGFAPTTKPFSTDGSIGTGGFTFGVAKAPASSVTSPNISSSPKTSTPSNNETLPEPSNVVFSTAASKPVSEGDVTDEHASKPSGAGVKKSSGFIFGVKPAAQTPSTENSETNAMKEKSSGIHGSAKTSLGSSNGFLFGAAPVPATSGDKSVNAAPFSFKTLESTKVEPASGILSTSGAEDEDSGATKKKRAADEDDSAEQSVKKPVSDLPKFAGFASSSTESFASLAAPRTDAGTASSGQLPSNPFSSAPTPSSSSSWAAPTSDVKSSSAPLPVFGSIKSSTTPATSTAPFSFPPVPMGAIKGDSSKETSSTSHADATKAISSTTSTSTNPFTFSAGAKTNATSTTNAPGTITNPFGTSSSTAPTTTITNPFSTKLDTTSGGALTTIPNPFSPSSAVPISKDSSKKAADIVNPFAASTDSSSTKADDKVATNAAPASPPRTARADSHHSQAADSPMSMMDTGYNSETNSNQGSSSNSLPPPAFNFNSSTPFQFGTSSGIASTGANGSTAPVSVSTATAAGANPFGSSSSSATLANPFTAAGANPFGNVAPSFPPIPPAAPLTSSDNKAIPTSFNFGGSTANPAATNPFSGGGFGAATANPFGGGSVANQFQVASMPHAAPSSSGNLAANPFAAGTAPAASDASGFSMGTANPTRRKVRVQKRK